MKLEVKINFQSKNSFENRMDEIYKDALYPKSQFVFLINSKAKFKILYLDFVFTSIWKTKLKELATIFMFNRLLLWIFNTVICFSFSCKSGKRNTVHFSFLNLTNKLEKELLEKIKINFMVIFTSMACTLFKNKLC